MGNTEKCGLPHVFHSKNRTSTLKKFFRILFFVFASFFAVACSSSSSDETETNISEQSDSDGENSEHKSEDASGAADVKFENQSLYSVSVYLSNPKYNSNLVVFAEVEAASSAEKKFSGDIDGATTFYFVYNLNNLGSAAYPYIPYDTISDHKTQKLSKDEQTTVIIDDIEDFKTDSAFLILQNDTTSSVYLVSGNSPLNPYGMDEKEIQYGKSAFYEIGGSGKGAIPFEKASELRVVINSSEYRELPKINYEAGKVYTVTVSKNAVERTDTTFFPSSGSVYEVAFANPKNPLQNRVASFEEGTELSADDLAALSVDGYDFVGWYIGDRKVEEGFKINQSYTFTAKFEAIEYTINYELNGGKNSTENPMSYTIESDSFSFAVPTRTGYKFSGWYETEDFAGSSTAGIESGSFGDKTLYAKWEAVSYTISYVLNGGENSSENRSEYTIESDSITLASPSKTGATFLGWYETENFSGSKITSIPKGSVGNKTFYAKWNFITYSISYELNGGTNAAGNPTSYTTGSDTVAILNPTRSGYSFSGWYKTSDFSGNSVSEIESGSFGNITLYAKWEAISYTISYVLNGGENSSENRSEYTIESDSITLASPSKNGATFLGWYETENFSGSKISSIPKGSMENKTFYAKWNLITYTISYELNGGTNAAGNPKSYTIESRFVYFSAPTRTGYTFAGWYTSEDFSENPVTKITSGTFGNITMYAKWQETIYTAETIADLDLSEISGAYTIKVAGDISDYMNVNVYTMVYLADKIKKAVADITLDLSEATGVTELKPTSAFFEESDFVNCKKLKSVILPNCLKTLGDYAFKGCTSIESITLPEGLTTIGSAAFSGCSSIESITLPASLTSIGSSAFGNCTNLKTIIVPDSVTNFGTHIFGGCKSLTDFTTPNGMSSIPEGTFYNCTSLENIVISDFVTSIGEKAFGQCESLVKITIPASVKRIAYECFLDCTNLKSITFTDTTTWYYCGSWLYANGTQISVNTPTLNATYFTSTYLSKNWYKE